MILVDVILIIVICFAPLRNPSPSTNSNLLNCPGTVSNNTNSMLTVPSFAFGMGSGNSSGTSSAASSGGAIPRTSGSSTGNSSSSAGTPSSVESKRCFCGHYSEVFN